MPITIMPQITSSVRDSVRAIHDDGAEALRHARHLADHDDEPGEAEAEPQAGEDRGQRGRQHHLEELRVAAAAEHRGGLEQLRLHAAHAEDGVEQDRIEGAEEDQEEGRLARRGRTGSSTAAARP